MQLRARVHRYSQSRQYNHGIIIDLVASSPGNYKVMYCGTVCHMPYYNKTHTRTPHAYPVASSLWGTTCTPSGPPVLAITISCIALLRGCCWGDWGSYCDRGSSLEACLLSGFESVLSFGASNLPGVYVCTGEMSPSTCSKQNHMNMISVS